MPYNKTEQKDAAPMRRRPMRRRKKALTVAVKRARQLALIPYVVE